MPVNQSNYKQINMQTVRSVGETWINHYAVTPESVDIGNFKNKSAAEKIITKVVGNNAVDFAIFPSFLFWPICINFHIQYDKLKHHINGWVISFFSVFSQNRNKAKISTETFSVLRNFGNILLRYGFSLFSSIFKQQAII